MFSNMRSVYFDLGLILADFGISTLIHRMMGGGRGVGKYWIWFVF
jgi:hypothetical protein